MNKIELNYSIEDLFLMKQNYSIADNPSFETMFNDLANKSFFNDVVEFKDQCFKATSNFLPNIFKKNEKVPSNKAEEILNLVESNNKYSYVKIHNHKCTIPIGLSVTLDVYINKLIEMQKISNLLVENVLAPAESYLSLIVNDLKKLESNYITHNVKFNNLKNLKKDFSNLIKNTQQTKAPYKDIVKSNSTWSEIAVSLIKLDELTSIHKPDLISNKVNNLSRLSGIITEELMRFDSKINANAKMISFLSNVFYQIAEEIEFYAMLHTQYIQLNPVLESIYKDLKSI